MSIPVSQPPHMRRIHHIHFVGIGGVGMAGIAEVLLNLGYQISGSDKVESHLTQHLQALGARVHIGHDASYVKEADVVVRSSAITADNPELCAAHKAHIPVVPRAEMLGELMRFCDGIAIAGTHGKTTTTSLVTALLTEGGCDPTFVIGGQLNSVGSNAHLGSSRYFVAEADESDASFLYLQPQIAIVTNIDADHMGTYGGDFENLKKAFVDFLHRLPFYGLAVLCIDDPVIHQLLPEISRPMVTYGLTTAADIYATHLIQTGTRTTFTVHRKGKAELAITLNLPGRHNVLNALSAIAVAGEVGVSDEAIVRALEGFSGVMRRFQVTEKVRIGTHEVTGVDDYGHHPKELAVTFAAIRAAWPNRRLVVVFQPHRYTRTQDLFEDFVSVLSEVDQLILMDVYSAGEPPIEGADSAHLAKAVAAKTHKASPLVVAALPEVRAALEKSLQAGDILLLQGAGTIGLLASTLFSPASSKDVVA